MRVNREFHNQNLKSFIQWLEQAPEEEIVASARFAEEMDTLANEAEQGIHTSAEFDTAEEMIQALHQ